MQFRSMLFAGALLGAVSLSAKADLNHTTTGGYGYPLDQSKTLTVWWAEGCYKILPDAQPTQPARPMTLDAARNEYESLFITLRPTQATTLKAISLKPFVSEDGKTQINLPAQFRRTEYVNIAQATDAGGGTGRYPDPLPLLKGPQQLPANQNTPLLVTLRVPKQTLPAIYHSELSLTLQTDNTQQVLRYPLSLNVRTFTLPDTPSLRSGFGLDEKQLFEFDNAVTLPQQKAKFDRVMRQFGEYKISPYDPFVYAPLKVTAVGDSVHLDSRNFLRAAQKYFAPPYNFNAFDLNVEGLGGGTYYARNTGTFMGHKEGSPRYEHLMKDYLKKVQQVLAQGGLLDKAYVYWFDEPGENDYPFIRKTHERIRAAAPKLQTFLTEHVHGADIADVTDISCTILPNISQEQIDRRLKLNRTTWSYICCNPKSPWISEFIDHDAINFRIWGWASYAQRMEGILIWRVNYWHSPEAYPDALQNPWEDTMSWVTSYGTPKGAHLPWGNGDGRLFYPQNRHPGKDKTPYLGPMVPSVRLEFLRAGIEDYEYFRLLEKLTKRLPPEKAALRAQAEALLKIPASVYTNGTVFTRNPQDLLAYRARLADCIEALLREIQPNIGQKN